MNNFEKLVCPLSFKISPHLKNVQKNYTHISYKHPHNNLALITPFNPTPLQPNVTHS